VIFHKRNRRVRMHLQAGPTIQGVLMGRTGGHYVLWAPKVLEGEDATVTVSGHVEIPCERVLFYQVIG
jgi:hypothetical protein